jgi:glycosyltransferase involved in cell wall biosynthesis
LAQAILRVIAHPYQAREMAQAGRKLVEAHFSMQAKLDAMEELYRHLTAAASTA